MTENRGSAQTLITTPFGFGSTAAEVVEGIDLGGKRAIITGGASGIGVETARALAGAGAAVTLAVRRTGDGEEVAAGIRSSTGNDEVAVAPLELTDRASIAAFVAAWDRPLDILVNNAGVMAIQELTLTDRGQEMQFATNHLGHFALAVGLHDALAAAGSARVVSVSSSGHLRSPVIFDDLDYSFREYDPFGAYGQSKTANVLFAVEATRRWAGDGITANALMPGGIATALQRHVGGAEYMEGAVERFRQAGSALKTVEQGAATSVLLATSPQLERIGGRYFEDCNQAPVIHRRGDAGLGGVAPYALDRDNAERLWEVSLGLIAAT
jgi:NAD(P)-dependent dehydrogenase (short-subunit alcohol dehydrogenase family)